MPCNCSRRAIQQTMQKVEREDKIKKQKEEIERLRKEYELKKQNEIKKENELKKQNIIKLHDIEPHKINSINITGGKLEINYKGGSPVTQKGYVGLLADTAFKAAKTLKPTGADVFRSVGYFGVGFGGNTLGNGPDVLNLRLDQLDLTKYTHINVAFVAVDSDGHLELPNSFGTRGSTSSSTPQWLANVQKGGTTGYDYVQNIFIELNKQRTNSNNKAVKIVPSIGGWNIANNKIYGNNLINLSKAASLTGTNNMYTHFKDNIESLVKNANIDGVDIDWEYPGRNPMISQCCKGDCPEGSHFDCGVSDPTSIAYCKSDDPKCTRLATASKPGCQGKNWNEPMSLPKIPESSSIKGYTVSYANFMTKFKTDLLSMQNKHDNDNLELSIALAGANWGLHWYIDTVSTLLKNNQIDYANVMAYDYTGYWQNGQASGFLSNYTNMDTFSECNYNKTCRSKKCVDCQNTCAEGNKCGLWTTSSTLASCESPTSNMQGGWCPDKTLPECTKAKKKTNCSGTKGFQFTNNQNNLTPVSSDQGCPLIYYNNISGKGADITSTQIAKFITGKWWNDNDLNDSKTSLDSTQPYFTLSVQSILNILTENGMGVNPKQLVVGLPYYGRTFQSTNKPTEGTYGLFTGYDYGSAYSFSDIYHKHYKDSGNDVYTIEFTKGKYKEDVVYTKALISKLTPEMKYEMISYGSAAATHYKVQDIRNKYGGYMCWHMLSDYYENVPTS